MCEVGTTVNTRVIWPTTAPLFILCLKAQFRVCLFKAENHSLLWLVSSFRPEKTPPIVFLYQLYMCFCIHVCAGSVTVSLWHHNLMKALTSHLKAQCLNMACPGLLRFTVSDLDLLCNQQRRGNLLLYNKGPLRAVSKTSLDLCPPKSLITFLNWKKTW